MTFILSRLIRRINVILVKGLPVKGAILWNAVSIHLMDHAVYRILSQSEEGLLF